MVCSPCSVDNAQRSESQKRMSLTRKTLRSSRKGTRHICSDGSKVGRQSAKKLDELVLEILHLYSRYSSRRGDVSRWAVGQDVLIMQREKPKKQRDRPGDGQDKTSY